MKALLYAQFNPVKTLKQVTNDRTLYRALIVISLVVVWCC